MRDGPFLPKPRLGITISSSVCSPGWAGRPAAALEASPASSGSGKPPAGTPPRLSQGVSLRSRNGLHSRSGCNDPLRTGLGVACHSRGYLTPSKLARFLQLTHTTPVLRCSQPNSCTVLTFLPQSRFWLTRLLSEGTAFSPMLLVSRAVPQRRGRTRFPLENLFGLLDSHSPVSGF